MKIKPKMGRPPKNPDELHVVRKNAVFTEEQYTNIIKASDRLRMNESSLFRAGTLLLIKKMESGDMTLEEIRKFASTT